MLRNESQFSSEMGPLEGGSCSAGFPTFNHIQTAVGGMNGLFKKNKKSSWEEQVSGGNDNG